VSKTEDAVSIFLREKFGENIREIQALQREKVFIRVDPGVHKEVLGVLLANDEYAGISAITGLDLGNSIELLYHVRSRGKIITIRTTVPKDQPRIGTITDICTGADFHEREVADLLGVTFSGHPSPGRFLLPDTWPDDIIPLRKDAKVSDIVEVPEKNIVAEQAAPASNGERMINVTIGPQHPALIEPEKFSLSVDGEIVKKVVPRLGYVHRGIEKATEQRTYLQNIYLVERICGICNACHASAFCQAVEAIGQTSIPSRAAYLRTIIQELNRLQSHMLLLGHFGYEIGFESLFQYIWRDREPLMNIMEMLTGNRVMASFVTIGGVRRDLKAELIPKIKKDLAYLQKRMVFYRNMFENDGTLALRVKNVGVISKLDAIKLCVVGPVARSSGISMDVRKDEPYAAYAEIPFKIVTYTEGDSWARLMVRVDEITESINIINYALDNLPSGSYRVKVPRTVPVGEAISRVEAPRGELFYYVKSNGSVYPERVKMRTPTFANILAFARIAEGGNIADVPASFASLDPCFSCTDR